MHDKFLALLLAAVLFLPFSLGSASASTMTLLDTQVHDYGFGHGKVNPGGSDPLGFDYVKVRDNSHVRFSDRFDLSHITGQIKRFELTLGFRGAGPSCPFGLCGLGEIWSVRVTGSDASSSVDDLFGPLVDAWSPTSFVATALSDTGTADAFAHSVATDKFEFLFSENSVGYDWIKVDYAKLDTFGYVTPVPLPGAGLMLFAALGGLGWFKRHQKTA